MIARLGSRFGGAGMRRLAQRSGWSLGGTVVTTFVVFAETILLARELGPAVYGVLLLIFAVPEAVLQVLDLKVREAMNKFLGHAVAREDYAGAVPLMKLFWLFDAAVGIVCVGIVTLLAGPMAELTTGDSGNAGLMILYSLGLLLGTLDSASGTVLRVLDRFDLTFYLGAAGLLARLAAVTAAVLLADSLEAIVWARVFGELALTLLLGGASLVLLKRLVWEHRRVPISALGPQRGEILRFLLSTNLTSTLKMASTKLDTILIGVFATPSAVALYRFALQFARAPLLLSDGLYNAVFPTFSRAVALGRRREVRSVALTSTRILLITVLPASAIVALFGDRVLAAIGGARYGDAGLIFAICLLGVLPYCVLFWQRPLILTAGLPTALLRAQTAGTIVQITLLLALVPAIGGEGAAIAFAASNSLIVVIQARIVRDKRLLAVDDDG